MILVLLMVLVRSLELEEATAPDISSSVSRLLQIAQAWCLQPGRGRINADRQNGDISSLIIDNRHHLRLYAYLTL